MLRILRGWEVKGIWITGTYLILADVTNISSTLPDVEYVSPKSETLIINLGLQDSFLPCHNEWVWRRDTIEIIFTYSYYEILEFVIPTEKETRFECHEVDKSNL